MNCRYCGAGLTPGALFCGTCGRTVQGDGAPRRPRAVEEPPVVAAVGRCPQCGAAVAETDVFCRECGFVVQTVSIGGSRDTALLQPVEPGAPPAPPSAVEAPAAPPPQAPPLPTASAPPPPPLPTASTRLPGDPEPRRESFVLQFSTGESVIVGGTGLVGRNPGAQPGERIEQLVVVGDAGKSVSKTHLEFGQEAGEFWVSDRYSTNGTVIRVPGAEARRCEPGHRYRVPRGTRIEIGDQFFVVS